MASTQDHSQEFSDYEKVYLQMSRAFKPIGKEHWGIHCICSIQVHDKDFGLTIKSLRNAWKSLAVDFPGLTVRPVQFTKQYQDLDEAILESWADETLHWDPSRQVDEIIQDAPPSDLPSLHFLPQSSEIVFLSQHWRTDALGCCVILDRLIDHLGAKQVPAELSRTARPQLSPCLETAAGASFDVDEEIQTYALETIEAFHAQAVRSGGLPYRGDDTLPPGNTRHRELIFSIDDTDHIAQACRSQDFTVSAAIHTALARAYFSFTDVEEQKQKGYTTVMAVNARPHLQSPYDQPSHACQSYVASITPTVPYNADFATTAQDLTHQYKTWCNDKLLKSLCWAYKYHLEKLTKPRRAPTGADAPPPKPPSGVTLSSLGIVEKHLRSEHGSVSVAKFRFGVSMMTRQTLLYAWTFRGELTLSLDYNEAYYSEEMAQEVLDKVRGHLVAGLELES